MTTQTVHDQNVVYVEYCRSCETHSWCTHHDQAKYHDTYLKLSEMLTQRYPYLEIIGNMVPSHLIPFKIAQNKYIDSNTNKYVVYPQIGSFEVRLNSTIIFSKKETNSWPNLHTILSKISSIINPNYQSPNKIENTSKSPKKSNENTPSKTHKNNDFLKSNDEKKTHYKDQAKGFTLTDHFKIYKSKFKHEDKDWLTEKHESDGSSRQISQFGRGESRERSDRGDQFKSVMSDFSGDSKLKEMLKNKGLTLKDHGKKEMIIKLDSIEEQNGNYEDYGATQRTAEKPTKKTQKIEELQNAFSNLQNKFIKFESKVKDIQNKNDNFDYRKPDSNELQANLNIRDTDKSRKDEQKRSNVKQLPSFEKQGAVFVERPSKLEIYLNASEQEKNEKLYRIYGEWKVLKQAEKRNKKLLKNISRKGPNQGSSEEQTSQADSASPSSMANVLTFKPKMENNIQKQITSLLKSNKGQKYSTIEKVQTPNTVARDHGPKFRTDDHFYNKNYLRNPRIDSDNEKQSEFSSKLFKNSTNTMSLQALRSGVKQSMSKNASMNQLNPNNLSQSAQQNISKINARISNIQAQLNKHKENQALIRMGLEPQSFNPSRDHNKSRSNSDASSQLSSKKFSHKNSKQGLQKSNEQARNSYRGYPLKKAGHGALVKRSSKFSQTNGRYNTNKPKNQSTNIQATIQEESQIQDSNVVTQRSQEHYREQSGAMQNKRIIGNKKNGHTRQQVVKQRQNKNREQEEISDSQETNGQNTKRQKESKIQQHELHDPVTFLRRQKEWREAGGTKQSSRKQPKHISQHAEGNSNSLQKQAIQTNKFRFSEAKNSPLKPTKSRATRGLAQTPKKGGKPMQQAKDNLAVFQKAESFFGKIKKNKKKDELLLRQNSNSSNNYSAEAHEDNVQGEPWDEEDVSNHSSGQTEGEPIRQQHSQPVSGRIVRNNSKPLSYYKSQDIVIQGQSRQSNLASEELNFNQSGIKLERQAQISGEENFPVQEQTKVQKSKKKQSRRSSNERVEGWETNSETEENQFIASSNEDQEAHSAKQPEESSGSNKRRNSLDNELQQIDNAVKVQQVEVKGQNTQENHENEETQDGMAPVPALTKSAENLNNGIDVPIISSASAPEITEAPLVSGVSEQIVTFPKVSRIAGQSEAQKISVEQTNLDDKSPKEQAVIKVEKIGASKDKKNKKPTKQNANKPKKKQSNNPADPKSTKSSSKFEQVQDIEKIICQQYAQYLQLKTITNLSKLQSPQNSIEPKEYENVEFTVHVSYCPSSDSIPEDQPQCPSSFMEYNPIPSVGDQLQEEENSSEQEVEEIEEEESQQQNSLLEEKGQDDLVQKVDPKNESKIIQAANVIPVVSAIKNSQQAPSNFVNGNANSSKLVSSVFSSDPPSNSDPITNPLESMCEHQTNNVYCQPKEASKFKEIGVQKQSTFQVSVQTDHPQTTYPAILTRVNSIPSYPVEPRQESPRNIFQLQQTRSDFNNTVRNNFVSESKKTAFYKKPKKQIQRADIINKIYSQDLSEEIQKFAEVIKGSYQEIVKENGVVLKLEEMYPNGPLIGAKGLEIELITTKFTNLLKITEILSEKSEWLISRLFEDKHGILQSQAFGVWLCHQNQWKCIIVDQNLRVDEQNKPLYSKHHGNQMWYNILEKALAVALGGYGQLHKAESSLLFSMLTGCNTISAKIRQDPTKNAKLLHLVTDCLRKNYIIYAHKNFDKNKLEEGRQAVYYVCSVRRSGQDETLVEVSQDGRESFWVKLSKFVQEFNKIDILHLRVNHNFAHLDLGVGRPGQLTVIELGFVDEGQGCVTLSYLGQTGALKAYLYKEQKNKVLKLVGQAKQKLKSHLFFQCSFSEGRYFVFAQAEEKPTRIAFLGQGRPSIRITQEIHSEGLKNQMAEYLPVKENDQNRLKQRAELQSGNDWRERRGPRLKDNFVQSRLRETFMDYVVGRSRRN